MIERNFCLPKLGLSGLFLGLSGTLGQQGRLKLSGVNHLGRSATTMMAG
jgi:hypothetical protein